MHEVSSETTEAAQKHALELIEQGKHVTDVAQRLKNGNSTEIELAQHLEPYGEIIQEHAHRSLDSALNLQSNRSNEVLSASIEEHVEAANAHIQAVKVWKQSKDYYK
jgi:inhibitor of KinA sporulation pathway (predicted exonuclease)